MKTKYFLAQDEDSHWYVVEAKKRKQWEKWRDGGYEDEPVFIGATQLGYHPSFVEFENPKFK